MTLQPFAVAPVLGLLASTGPAGFALVNGTGPVISWTAPGDGQLHRVQVLASILVTSAETGGLVQVQWTGPGGAVASNNQLFAAGLAASTSAQVPSALVLVVAPGTTVSVRQNSALTVGAATVWAEIWGS